MHSARVFEITIRSPTRVRGSLSRKKPKIIEGTLAALPCAGESIIVFRDDKMSRLITSTVIRVLSGTDGDLYAETRNSVYRIVLASATRITK